MDLRDNDKNLSRIERLTRQKEDIEDSIEDLSQRFPFYTAMEKLHSHDEKVRRADWRRGEFIERAVDVANDNGLGVFIIIHLPNKDGQDSRRAPWLPTPADLFAEDWMMY
jgi:hypothetical protein